MIQFKVPKKFVSIISLIFSVLNFFSASGSCIPVQNTQISIVGNFSTISWKTFLALDSSFTSRGNEWIFELLLFKSWSKFSLRADAATCQPSVANFIAKALPIPLLAPVIQIFFVRILLK